MTSSIEIEISPSNFFFSARFPADGLYVAHIRLRFIFAWLQSHRYSTVFSSEYCCCFDNRTGNILLSSSESLCSSSAQSDGPIDALAESLTNERLRNVALQRIIVNSRFTNSGPVESPLHSSDRVAHLGMKDGSDKVVVRYGLEHNLHVLLEDTRLSEELGLVS